MKYLWVLFIFLLSFAVFVTFTVIADGDIENILNTAAEANDIQVYKNYIIKIKENEFIDSENSINSNTFENFENPENSENLEHSGEDTEKQIIISVYDTKTNDITLIDLEEYLCGVVFSEMPSSFEIEALKAQAVAARSFCIYKMLCSTDTNREDHHGADICNDYRHCKDYISYEEACEKYGEDYIKLLWEKIQNSVYSTKNEIITYKSEPAIAVFHAISGKGTESAENIWGNAVPYLVSVPTEEENNKDDIKNYTTESIYSAAEFKDILLANGFGLRADFSKDESFWISDIKLNSSGRVDTVNICGKIVTGRRLREIFDLRSTDFTLEYKNQAFIFTVTGYGHGVGLSQYGANLIAAEAICYQEIPLWYYTDVEKNYAGKFI